MDAPDAVRQAEIAEAKAHADTREAQAQARKRAEIREAEANIEIAMEAHDGVDKSP